MFYIPLHFWQLLNNSPLHVIFDYFICEDFKFSITIIEFVLPQLWASSFPLTLLSYYFILISIVYIYFLPSFHTVVKYRHLLHFSRLLSSWIFKLTTIITSVLARTHWPLWSAQIYCFLPNHHPFSKFISDHATLLHKTFH